jgi:tRNA(fMet)-specific endonuclease VapC
MYLLDTDHMSLLERGGPEGSRIRNRIRAVAPDEIATAIVTYEEQIRGWMARLARDTHPERQIEDYGELKRQLNNYCKIAVIEYDAKAVAIYEHLRQARIRIGTMDLKIAAIALANNATLLTRNLTKPATSPTSAKSLTSKQKTGLSDA